MKASLFRPVSYKHLNRFGSSNDGGYILPTDIPLDYLLSMGLGHNWDFERELIEKQIVKSFVVYDHTVSMNYFLRNVLSGLRFLPREPMILIHRLKLLAGYMRFFSFRKNHIKKRVTSVSDATFDSQDIDKVLNHVESIYKSLVVKVDIEGDEYKIIDGILKHEQRITVLVIEFHSILKLFELFSESLNLIQESYTLVHCHFNNFAPISSMGIPDVAEMTFVRSELVKTRELRRFLPVEYLDASNSKKRPDHAITW